MQANKPYKGTLVCNTSSENPAEMSICSKCWHLEIVHFHNNIIDFFRKCALFFLNLYLHHPEAFQLFCVLAGVFFNRHGMF